uniref:SFRICE_002621 n=1 Tax=Spodoptera frugiperda TaxID=7108 RepID=A0A2H1WJV5_SPOFR
MGCCDGPNPCCDNSLFKNPHVAYIAALLVMVILYLSWALYQCQYCDPCRRHYFGSKRLWLLGIS